jgi:periplasmic copper chaperone A
MRWSWLVLAGAVLAMAPAGTRAAGDEAHVARVRDLEIVHAWARASQGPDGAVYLSIHNGGQTEDRLLGGRAEIAAAVEVHGATMRDGVMTSEPLGAMPIPGGADLELEPAAVFLKLVGLREPLLEGGHFDMVIECERAGSAEVEVSIEAADATEHSHAGHRH